ncbi:TPA: methylated-DNA--[protein]-cysteine S-methyltransferase [Escherichia coli]|uniref:methylated-DNA--[protein]-cysteine S-methyltransferase n=1 Tax=Escherichia coli TaxID=562 RepID=UPI0028B2C1A6|nr:methylated-DNA--[protein]-cysteine S-methyltransferase [Escherichia coli]MDT5378574.1 Methylated-DNA--protein-cysteine methyltransferase [Escherichia coli]HEI0780555.1 methylated-DNA--[protein]-cysteine S-methyltransferase [Escherichia coli]HEI0794880.1 methylated-DNA--[protein]-cysteine S-methyltransferase [Escherichia coli]HEI0804380.1 methylated-DNA--[protein]-cysteine S-methyltransferase [Escherichia coli]HEI0808659.1 methylated-DNA--[protein]-cysteine S-methyltransferase [Escherichia c
MLRLLEEKIATPLGPLWVICDEQFRLRAVEWEEYSERMVQLLDIHYRKEGYERISATNPGGLSDKLSDYFAGNLSIIDTLPTATGGMPFQREVWKTLRTIPCGQVMHYGQLAEQLGRPGAARAVGAANGSNPISIVVPCHRVIGRNGTMTGYAGGVQRKEWLLRHEGYLLL